MRFGHRNIIVREAVHNRGQILIDSTKDGHPKGEIGSPEERFSFLSTNRFEGFFVLCDPSCATAHHFHALFPRFLEIAVGRSGIGKFDGNFCRTKSIAVEVFHIVYINNRYNFVTTLFGDVLNHMAHFAISNECYLHIIVELSACLQ